VKFIIDNWLLIAIAIASGAAPVTGLITAIIGGFLISALGGSRVQIGGPTGAFIVVVYGVIAEHGHDGLVLATLMAGAIMVIAGYFKAGSLVKHIPEAVINGFTIGIAIIIATSQLSDLFGLDVADLPADFLPKTAALWQARDTLDPRALGLGVATIAIIVMLRRLLPRFPGLVVAIALCSAAVALLGLPVDTIQSRYGALPGSLPWPQLPSLSVARMLDLLPSALIIAFLAGVESLLSASVADRMIGGNTRPNAEVIAGGAANIGSALFGGLPATGAIARTATNVRAGAHGPVAGMLHALFLLLFMAVAAPLAAYIPLAGLAGVLAVVSWNMVERPAIAILLRSGRGEAIVLAATFFLTIFRDLTEAIIIGFALGSVLFIHKMSQATAVTRSIPLVGRDEADTATPRAPYDEQAAADREVAIYRITGALFFGAAAAIGSVFDRINDSHRALIVDFSAVPFLDSTGATMIEALAHKADRQGVTLWLTGADRAMRRVLLAHGLRRPLAHYAATVDDALSLIQRDRPHDS
jgi:SulP family sulfate permease